MERPIHKVLSRIKRLLVPPPPEHLKHSYSQCGEDLILAHLFNELGIAMPHFIDIGAHHPRYINNTYLLHLKGSRGVNIEPDPTLFQRFTAERPQDTNLNLGIGAERTVAELYIMNEPTLNTFVKAEAERVHAEHPGYFIERVAQVQVRTINEVFAEHAPADGTDLLSLDVEGLDEVVVRSMDGARALPKVMCIETVTFSTKGEGVKKTDLIEHVKQRGYLVYADTFINTIFVRNDLWPPRRA